MKNKIIIIGGYCATGKSTFSLKLSKSLNIPCFNKDTIKEVLGDGFGPENNMVYHKGSPVTFLLILHIVERFLQAGKECIIESNFNPNEIIQLKILLDKYNCECLSYMFKGDFDILYNRYIQRDNLGERHWVHKPAGENKEAFREGHLKSGIGEIITIDTTSFANMDYEKLYTIAKKFIINGIQ